MQKKYSIPQPKISSGSRQIPFSVAEFSEEEESNLKIDFRFYNDKICEIKLLGKKSKSALEKIKLIGQSKRSNLLSNGVKLYPVYNSGDYKKLFGNNLPEEYFDSLKEHKFGGTCRIFCVLEGNICNIIAITFNHLETNKHRR